MWGPELKILYCKHCKMCDAANTRFLKTLWSQFNQRVSFFPFPKSARQDSVRRITAEVGIGFTPLPVEKNSHCFSFSLKGCGCDFF